jgi:hypothetical protein
VAKIYGGLSMLRAATVVFLIALFSSLVAVAEVGPPPQDVGEALEAWDRIKHSNDVSELEAFIARYKDAFLAKLARRRIEQLDRQRIVRPEVVPPAAPLPASN